MMDDDARPELADWPNQCRVETAIDREGMSDAWCERPKGHIGWHFYEDDQQVLWFKRKDRQ